MHNFLENLNGYFVYFEPYPSINIKYPKLIYRKINIFEKNNYKKFIFLTIIINKKIFFIYSIK